jgi:hypothetical protein
MASPSQKRYAYLKITTKNGTVKEDSHMYSIPENNSLDQTVFFAYPSFF